MVADQRDNDSMTMKAMHKISWSDGSFARLIRMVEQGRPLGQKAIWQQSTTESYAVKVQTVSPKLPKRSAPQSPKSTRQHCMKKQNCQGKNTADTASTVHYPQRIESVISIMVFGTSVNLLRFSILYSCNIDYTSLYN